MKTVEQGHTAKMVLNAHYAHSAQDVIHAMRMMGRAVGAEQDMSMIVPTEHAIDVGPMNTAVMGVNAKPL